MQQKTVLLSYYGATIIFLILDVVFGLSIRIAFLDTHVVFKMLYYGFCMACFVLMIWKPKLTVVISAAESLVTLVSLIVVMGMRVMVPSDAMIELGSGVVTAQEIMNFVIAGSIAYIAWMRGIKELAGTR